MSHPFSDECLENWARGDLADVPLPETVRNLATELLVTRRNRDAQMLTIRAMARHAQELSEKLGAHERYITEFLKHFDRCDTAHLNQSTDPDCCDWMDHEATVALGNLRAIVREQK